MLDREVVTSGIASDLSIEVYRRTLYQPYQTHVQRNSDNVLSNALATVGASSSSPERISTT